MKKAKLSDEQLGKVVSLRRSGKKWLQIEREAGIPRRIAKREYEDWGRKQALSELKDARKAVAAEAFRDHIDSLIKIAEYLVAHLRAPSVHDFTTDADQFLNELWKTDILKPYESGGASHISLRGTEQYNLRGNLMLFDALKEHTGEDVRWELSNEWKRCWNNCINLLGFLQGEISKRIVNFFNQEEEKQAGFLKKVRSDTNKRDPIVELARAVLGQVLKRVVDDDPDLERHFVRLMPQPDGIIQLVLSDSFTIILKFMGDSLARKVEYIVNSTAKNLCIEYKGNKLKSLRVDVGLIYEITKELEEMLNPLVLRPIILRTRCKLCPA